MGCFCGCQKYQPNENGFLLACTRCGHGPQNHQEQFRMAARANQKAGQRRDADFG